MKSERIDRDERNESCERGKANKDSTSSGGLLSGSYLVMPFNAEIGRHRINAKKVVFDVNVAIHHRADESSTECR